jgi:flagellar protein FlaG
MDKLSALSGPGPSATQPLPSCIANAVNAAKNVAERQVPAVPEDVLTETYRQITGGDKIAEADTRVQLDVDSSTGRVVGKVIDRQSGEVMHQLPSPEMLQLIAKAKELFGELVNEKV